MYGLAWILLAAKIACWTCGGASAGAAALPSGSSWATAPATTMSVGAGGGGGGGGVYTAPPVPEGAGACAAAVAGAMRINDVVIARANARRETKIFLFRRPTGLADGLTLKEPASHACA